MQPGTGNGAGGAVVLDRPAPGAPDAAPAVVSRNGYMRRGLPAIYQANDLAMRFVGALERVLDPCVAILDSLDHHLDPDLAPRDLLEVMAAWVGIELDESWPEERCREMVRRAGELHRRRGTRAGLELALAIAFPDLPLRVADAGGVTWRRDPEAPPAAPAAEGEPDLVVYCDVPITEPTPALLARTIELLKPAGASYRLRIRQAGGGGS